MRWNIDVLFIGNLDTEGLLFTEPLSNCTQLIAVHVEIEIFPPTPIDFLTIKYKISTV